jgi:hypothetical protein
MTEKFGNYGAKREDKRVGKRTESGKFIETSSSFIFRTNFIAIPEKFESCAYSSR